MNVKSKNNFFRGFFEEDTIPAIYDHVMLKDNGRMIPNVGLMEGKKHKVYSVFLIPDYLELSLKEPGKFSQTTITQKNLGYTIRLDGNFDIDAHLKTRFKSNHKVIRRYKRRLESCFNIDYRMIYGEVEKKEYEHLMSALKGMIVRRFNQLNSSNENLDKWDEIKNLSYKLMKEKKASLFIIYNNKTPIDISLNFHVDEIMFASIGSYDIDYEKFGLGHVEIYKMLEWCVGNNYKMMEMGYGDWDYKRRWSNHMYQFKHQIVFDKTSFFASMLGHLNITTIKIKEKLKDKNLHLWLKKWSKPKRKGTVQMECIGMDKDFQFSKNQSVHEIDINNEENDFLKKQLYDFLYSSTEHIENVKVFKMKNQDNSYVFKGNTFSCQLTFRLNS